MQDLARINALIDEAAKKCGGSDNKLAETLGKSRQTISNWRHGQKTPSVEAQAEIAALGGCSVAITVLISLFEDAIGVRRARLQEALKEWARDQDAARKREIPYDWRKALESGPEIAEALKQEREKAPTPAGLVPATWKRKADVIKRRVEDVGNF